jgi:hypothetical protein
MSSGSDASKLRIGEVVHRAQRDPCAPLLQPAIGPAFILIRFCPTSREPEASEVGVLVWFWLGFWQGLCLVPFRGSGDGDSRAMYQNHTLASRPEEQPDPGAPSPARSCCQRVKKRKY